MSLLPIEAGQPLTRTSSLIETGTPSIADNGSPFFQRRSEARAALSASPASTLVKALICGLTFSVRASTAFMVSTGEALPFAVERGESRRGRLREVVGHVGLPLLPSWAYCRASCSAWYSAASACSVRPTRR